MIRGSRFVHCVLLRTSPVAVRVAVRSIESATAGDEATDVDERVCEVGVGCAF